MALRNSFQPNKRRNSVAETRLDDLRFGGSCPGVRELSFTMLQASQCAPDVRSIVWHSDANAFQLDVSYPGSVASWKFCTIIENALTVQWSIVTDDPQQVYNLLSKRVHPQQNSNIDAASSTNTPAEGMTFLRRYQIIKQIGKGGMGQVFHAKDLILNRNVALKVMNSLLNEDESARGRFDREIRSCLNLRHPNIVTVYDCGYTQDNSPYMVMEYLDGRPLDKVFKSSERLTTKQFVQIFKQISQALRYAHQHRVIHRDIKPSNIVLTEQRDSLCLAKLVDFGIAKDSAQTTGLTGTGEVVGTPLYMSPEQCQSEAVDHRSDIYSLGCVMYEALAGVSPFQADTPLASMMLHVSHNPSPLTQFNPRVPKELERIVFKTIAKEPGDRYQLIDDLLADLIRFEETAVDYEQKQHVATPRENHRVPQQIQSSRKVQDSSDEDTLLANIPDIVLPPTLQLLVSSGMIDIEEAKAVTIFTQIHGGDQGKSLVKLGNVDEKTYSVASDCVDLMERFGLNISEAASAFKYCTRKGISLESALAAMIE